MSKNDFYFSPTRKDKFTRNKGVGRKVEREHSRQFNGFCRKQYVTLLNLVHFKVELSHSGSVIYESTPPFTPSLKLQRECYCLFSEASSLIHATH